MSALLALLRKLDADLLRDHYTGRYLSTKIGELVVGIVWTYYMISALPQSVEMWMAYAGVLLGWSTVKYSIKSKRAANATTAPD